MWGRENEKKTSSKKNIETKINENCEKIFQNEKENNNLFRAR